MRDKISKKELNIERAYSYLMGFNYGIWDDYVEGFLEHIGLKKEEWEILKKEYAIENLDEKVFNSIERYFKQSPTSQTKSLSYGEHNSR